MSCSFDRNRRTDFLPSRVLYMVLLSTLVAFRCTAQIKSVSFVPGGCLSHCSTPFKRCFFVVVGLFFFVGIRLDHYKCAIFN